MKSLQITLVRPSMALKKLALEYRNEHFQHGESVINGSGLLDQMNDYEAWLCNVTNNADLKNRK